MPHTWHICGEFGKNLTPVDLQRSPKREAERHEESLHGPVHIDHEPDGRMTLQGNIQGSTEPNVTILLCTHNGAPFLADQLLSIERQTYRSWRVVASDDGSTDGTLQILDQFKSKMGGKAVTIRSGAETGFVNNFLALARDETIKSDFFAFADQDDIWESDKLARAVEWLKQVPLSVPALYCARTKHIDANGRNIGLSRVFAGPPNFENALVQSISGGNTMVFNEAARNLIRVSGATHAPAHDWLLYLLVTANGGVVHYDPLPSVSYRLHASNVIGHRTWPSRIRLLLKGQYRAWTRENLAILNSFRPYITDQNRIVLEEFTKLTKDGMFARFRALYRSGVYRRTRFGNVSLLIAVLLRRI